MIACQRHLFDIPDDVAYLNCAYMSPLMKPALEAGTAGLARKAHPWEITPDKFFTGADEFRATAAQLVGCSADDMAIAALPHVHWTSGGRLDLVRIGEACRNLGAALALDLTQSLGALPFSVGSLKNDLQNAVQPDFAVAASYKWLLGPYSAGLLYVAPKWQQGRAS